MTTSAKSRKICKYDTYEVFPARVFFDIRQSQNYQLMRPKPGVKTEDLKELYLSIYDTYFEKSNNDNARHWIVTRNRYAYLVLKKNAIKAVLIGLWRTPAMLWNNPKVKELRHGQISALNRILDEPISMENDFLDELDRVLKIEIGIIDNDISECEMQMDEMQKQAGENSFDYYKQIVAMEKAYGRTLDEKMVLPKYVEYENDLISNRNAK